METIKKTVIAGGSVGREINRVCRIFRAVKIYCVIL